MKDSSPWPDTIQWSRPIFLVSAGRSGSVYLTNILNTHSLIALTNEANLSTFFKLVYKLATSPETTEFGQAFLQHYDLIGGSYRAVLADLFLESMHDIWHRFYLQTFAGKRFIRWGDKMNTDWSMPEMRLLFPEAQYIHLVRDGRDRTVSTMQYHSPKLKKERPYMAVPSFEQYCTFWVRRNQQILDELQGHPYSVLVKYEDLIHDPMKEVKRILQFLELDEEKALFKYIGNKRKPGFKKHATSASPESSIGRWRHELTSQQQEIAHEIMGDMLRYFDYEIAR